jgi:hypothetical protein
MKQKQLSPEKYIVTRARSLPIDQCFVNLGWRDGGMANIMVMRRHVNNNVTAGIFLVDLLCLGVKDTQYRFNEPDDKLMEMVDMGGFIQIDYQLAHNIIYAGHDFAYEFGIAPHKDFAITKYILEEDNDMVPLLDIHTGDEEGKPHLMADTGSAYSHILQKLKTHAGEGNYHFTLGVGGTAFDGEADFDDEEITRLEDIADGQLDFDNVIDIETEELKTALEAKQRSGGDLMVIVAELFLRVAEAKEGDSLYMDFDVISKTPEYRAFTSGEPVWDEIMTAFNPDDLRNIDLLAGDGTIMDHVTWAEKVWRYFSLHTHSGFLTFSILDNGLPEMDKVYGTQLFELFDTYDPLTRLYLAAYWLLLKKPLPPGAEHIINAANINDALPGETIHAMHCRLYWIIRSSRAIHEGDKQQALFYYQLLSCEGADCQLRLPYAALLVSWLEQILDAEED